MQPPPSIKPDRKGLFGKDFVKALETAQGRNQNAYAARTLQKDSITWSEMARVFSAINEFIGYDKSVYDQTIPVP